ncbi:hypothetical protein HDU79_005786 [Rhizoclosmatium sp. JEL0117]|nr:hypothetical protein HDU79_005786 [Rhizoclosmatium sp. JEL0117]
MSRKDSTGGFAMVKTATEIVDDPDVAAVMGDYYTTITPFDASIISYHKIPYCGPVQVSYQLLDKNNYPYFFQMFQLSQVGMGYYQILKLWNVRRVAIICFYHDVCTSITQALNAGNIQILAKWDYQHRTAAVNAAEVDMYAQTLARVDARYIIILAPSGTTADIYFSLAINQSVGPDYVWLGYNLPMSQSDPVELYGANYYKYLRGFILPAWGAPQSDHMTSMQNMVTDNINIHTQVYGFNVTSNDIGIQTNAFQFFDCVGVLANGLSNIITEKGFNVSDLRKPNVQDHLNYTTFKSTGFRGLDADPIELTSFGDIATPYIYLVMDGLDENLGYKAFAVSDSDVQNLYPYITKDFVFQFYNGSVQAQKRVL